MRPESNIGMGIGIKNLREREIKEVVGGYQYEEGGGMWCLILCTFSWRALGQLERRRNK